MGSSLFQQSPSNYALNASGGVYRGLEYEGAGRERSVLEKERLAQLDYATRDGEEQEGIEVEVLVPNRQQRLALLDNPNNTRGGITSLQLTARDQRRGTFIDL